MQTGISKRAGFKYPVILPIVYYEGAENWTVPRDFKSRLQQGEAFGKYVPDFEYYLVPLKDYSNEQLLGKADEISLVMLINKLQTPEDVEEFRRIPPQKLEEILKETPKHLLDIIGNVLPAFLLKENVPIEEAEDLAGKVREKKMGMLFENMEKMDIQEERRKTEEQCKRTEEQRKRAEDAEERAEKAEAIAEKGVLLFVETCKELGISKEMACKRLAENYEIADAAAEEWIGKYWKK